MEEEVRKSAVLEYLKGVPPKQISVKLKRSKKWFFKWLKRYQTGGLEWYKERSRKPNSHPRQTTREQRELIVVTRQKLEQQPFAQVGCSAIKGELHKFGLSLPSDSTVNRILTRGGLTKRNCLCSEGYRIPRYVGKRIHEKMASMDLNSYTTGEPHNCRLERKGKDTVWMRRLLQGDISLDELEQDIGDRIPQGDIESLYNCVLRRPVRYRNRALSILSLLKGISRHRISEYLLISRKSVNQSSTVYKTEGVASIISDKGKRPLKQEDPAYVDKLFSILHAPPSAFGFNRTSWRQEDIRKVLADNQMPLSRSGIRSIIRKSGFKYRRAKTALTSNDPRYEEKVQEIKNILASLGPREKFFSIDEYGPFAVRLQGGTSLVPPGTIRTVPQSQKSKGNIILTAALELSTNQVTHFYSRRKNTAEMIKLLDNLITKYADEECIYFSWDGASWHASKELYKRVDVVNSDEYRSKTRCPLVRLVPLPTSAQFLNVIESVFSGMARAIIHNSDYQSVDECQAAIDRYFDERNRHYEEYPKKAGKRIWGKERVEVTFKESNNCKDPMYYR
ncbi:MAG: IS630 family transposase [Syntrophorhabdales bacterium]